jgi:hypothetical protein
MVGIWQVQDLFGVVIRDWFARLTRPHDCGTNEWCVGKVGTSVQMECVLKCEETEMRRLFNFEKFFIYWGHFKLWMLSLNTSVEH